MELFTINHLNFAYPEQEKYAISDLTLSVHSGEFLVLCGPSGCGKSTLLRQLKTVLAPHGRRSGEILFDGKNLDELSQREQTEKIGFVQQSPENQIVTDKVWHELAFGLESLGYETPVIRRRVAEMASFFGIEDWFWDEDCSRCYPICLWPTLNAISGAPVKFVICRFGAELVCFAAALHQPPAF